MGLRQIVNQLNFKVWILLSYPLRLLQSLRSNRSIAKKKITIIFPLLLDN